MVGYGMSEDGQDEDEMIEISANHAEPSMP